jgi:hypothetical protein
VKRIELLQRLVLLAALGAGSTTSGASAAGGLAEQLSHLRNPKLGEPMALPGGELRIGRALLRSSSPKPVRPLVADGRTIGLLLEGASTLIYRVDDEFSIPLAKRNLRSLTGLVPRPAGSALEIEKPLQGAAVWGFGLLPEPTGSAPATATAPLPAWLTELLVRKLGDNPERDLLLSSANGDSSYRWAAFHALGDDYVLDFDPQPAVRAEALGRMESIDKDSKLYGGRLAASTLVSQPIASQWWDARAFDFATTATEIELVHTRGTEASVTSRITLQALRPGVRILPFTLLSRFSDTDGKLRELRVRSLTVQGRPADYVHAEGALLIALDKPMAAGESVSFEVESEGDILDRPEGNSYWILRTESWYPKPFGSGTEHSTFRLEVESADPFVPFASGEILSREKTPTGTRVTTRIGVPAERAVAVAGRYTTFDSEYKGARVHVSTYASAKKTEAERLAGIVTGVRACLEAWLAVPFPFQDLQLVEIKDWGWGQAPPGVIFITQEAFMTPARAQSLDDPDDAAYYTRGVNERIAHEVAHTWFPHVAKVRRSEENWLSESFAEYSSIECLRKSLPDQKQGERLFQRAIRDWKFGTKEIGEGGSIYLASHLSGDREKDFYAWRALLYSKGPLVLHALREELKKKMGEQKGESAFLTWIRAYVQNFTYKTGETRNLVAILNQITAEDWQPWFERFVYGTEMPKVK